MNSVIIFLKANMYRVSMLLVKIVFHTVIRILFYPPALPSPCAEKQCPDGDFQFDHCLLWPWPLDIQEWLFLHLRTVQTVGLSPSLPLHLSKSNGNGCLYFFSCMEQDPEAWQEGLHLEELNSSQNLSGVTLFFHASNGLLWTIDV